MSRAAGALIRREGRPPQMLAAIALAAACVLGACDSSTPIPPSSPAGSPAARVEASAPVPALPSSSDPAPSASAAPQPTPTPDPEAVRKVAAAQYLAAEDAADLKKIQVPADMAADMRDLIRTSAKIEALSIEDPRGSNRFRNAQSRYIDAALRVRADLGLPPLCPDPPPWRTCPAA